MFEEVAVWVRSSADVAVRYVGFLNLESNAVWIAYGNYLGGDEEIVAEEMISAQSTLENFLTEMPTQADEWKPTIKEALTHFLKRNPDR